MPKQSFPRIFVAASLVLLLLPGAAVAAALEQPAVEPRASELLQAALAQLAESQSLRIKSAVVIESVLPSGQRLHYPATLEIALRRPDRLWYRLDGEPRGIAAWYDGKEFTLLDSEKNTCATTAVPLGLGPLFDDMAGRLGFRPPLSVLLREDSPSLVLKRMTSGFYVGRGDLDGTACHHLAFRQQNVDLEFWVTAEGTPAIKRIVIVRKALPGLPQLAYTIGTLERNVALDDALFRFVPPPDVVRCDFQSLAK